METTRSVYQSQIPGAASIHHTSIAFLIHCLRPRHAAWEWGFPSAAQSLRATRVGFGSRAICPEARFSKLNYLPTPPIISQHHGGCGNISAESRVARLISNRPCTGSEVLTLP